MEISSPKNEKDICLRGGHGGHSGRLSFLGVQGLYPEGVTLCMEL